MAELTNAISQMMDTSDYKALSNVKVSRVSIQPENKSTVTMGAGQNQDVYFSFPSRPNSFLDGNSSYLTFTYTMKGTEHGAGRTVALANGASSLIKSLETIAGAVSIEQIQNYNVIAAAIDDMQSRDRRLTMGSCMEDASPLYQKTCLSREVAAAAPPTVAAGDTNKGFHEKRRISIPLISLAVGTLQDRYLPLSRDIALRMRLTFEDPNVAFITSADFNAGYELEDITYEATYLETDSATYSQIEKESGGIMKISGSAISNFSSTLAAGGTTNTILIPARYSSLRSYITTIRDGVSAVTNTYNSPGGRTRANISSYQYRLHGTGFPQLSVPVDGFNSSEAFSELLKGFHGIHSTQQSVVFNSAGYVHNTGDTGSDHQGSFMISIDLEEPGQSAQSMSGVDSGSFNSFLELTHSSPVGSNGLMVDTFAFYDCVLELNTMTGEVMVSK
jgi:hypothetical protein